MNGTTKSAILVVTYVWWHTAHTWALCTILTRPEKMPNKVLQKSHINRLTVNKEYFYPWYSTEPGEVEFTHNFSTAYFKGLTFKRIRGGGEFGGNYICVEQDDEYRILKF